MALEVGSAYVTILPSMRGFSNLMSRELRGMSAIGQVAARDFSQGFGTTVSQGVQRSMRDVHAQMRSGNGGFAAAGAQAGQAYGQSASTHMQQIMAATQRGQTVGMSDHMQSLMAQTTRQSQAGMTAAGTQAGQAFGRSVGATAGPAGGAIGSSFGSSMLSAFNVSIVAAGSAIAGLVSMAKTAIDVLNTRERSRITYSAVLNIDSSQADALVRKIAKLDQLLPATASDLNNVASRFSTFAKGADDLYGMTESFAKAASATGSSSEEMVRAATQIGQSLSTGSLKYMDWKIAMPSIAGLAPKFQAEVEKTLGMPFQKALDDKVITADVFRNAIAKVAASPAIADGMAKMGDTLETHWAGAVGSFQQRLANAAEKYKPQLLAITDALGSAMQHAAGTFEIVLSIIARGVDIISPLAAVTKSWASSNKDLIGALAASIGVFLGVTAAVWALSFGIRAVSAAVLSIPIWGWIIAGAAAAVVAITYLYKTNEEFRNFVTRAWSEIQGAISGALRAIQPVVSGAVEMFGKVRAAVSDVWSIFTRGDFTGGLTKAFGLEEDSKIVDYLFRIRDAFLSMRDGIASDIAWLIPQFRAIWGSLQGIFGGLRDLVVSVFTSFVMPTLHRLVDFAVNTLWPSLQTIFTNLQPVIQLFGLLFVAAGAAIVLALRVVVAAINTVLVPVIQWLWSNIVSPVLNAIVWLLVKIVLPAFLETVKLISAALGALATVIMWAWTNVLRPVFTWIWDYSTHTLIPTFQAFQAVASLVWNAVGSKISSIGKTIGSVFDTLKLGVRAVQTVFESVTSAVGTTWDSMKAKVAAPVNFVINDVLNKGLGGAWDAIAGIIWPGDKKKLFPKLNPIKGFDTGGWTGPGDKLKPAGIVHADEFVIRKESQRSISSAAPGLLDALNRYGASALNALGAPGWAQGGMVYQAMEGWLRKNIPFAKVTSDLRPGSITATGNKSLHGAGKAVDMVATGKHTMMDIFNTLKSTWPGSAELIYSPAGDRQVKNGKDHFYGEPTRGMHFNHVHWAMQAFSDAFREASSGGFSLNPLDAVTGIINGITSKFGAGPVTDLVKGAASKLVSDIGGAIAGKANPSNWFGGDSSDTTPTGGLSGVKALANAVAVKHGWGSGPQWNAIDWIVSHESGWRPTAQNPKSTAYGLFQLLNGTWAGTGIKKTSDPSLQTEAGLRYIGNRYQTPLGAQKFWKDHHGYYANGGLVRSAMYDGGGILPPGVTMAVNKTGKPETIRTHEQERRLQAGLSTGGGNQYHFHVPDRDIATEVIQRMRIEEIRRKARERVMTGV